MSPLIVGSGSSGSEGRSDRFGLPTGTSDPGTAEAGDLYYKTDTNAIRVYDGSAWADLASGGGGGGGSALTLDNSLRFDSASSSYLIRTPATNGNSLTTWTWSMWVKRSLASTGQVLFSAGVNTADYLIVNFEPNDTLRFLTGENGSSNQNLVTTTAVFRDYSAWYHLVFQADWNNATQADRIKIYVNGIRQTISGAIAAQGYTGTTFNRSGIAHNIGRQGNAVTYFSGYIADVNFIDGSALAPTAFGATDNTTGVWNPIPYTGTYPGNSFHLDFATNDVGNDVSGNNNDWTANNFVLSAGAYIAALTSGGLKTPAGGFVKPFNSGRSEGTGGLTFTPPGGIAYTSSVEVYDNNSVTSCSINGATAVTHAANAWQTIASGSGTINTMFFERTDNTAWDAGFYAIRVDGQILYDNIESDWVKDSPTNGTASTGGDPGGYFVGNYATLNPINTDGSAITFGQGNLSFTSTGTGRGLSTISMRPGDGKFYCEFVCTSTANYNHPGIFADSVDAGTDSNRIVYRQDGNVYIDGTFGGNIPGFSNGDTIGMAFDADTRQLTYYKNGSPVGGPYQASTPPHGGGYYYHILSGGSSGCTGTFNFGQNGFIYTAPALHKSLNTANLPTPAILNGEDYMDVVTWIGDGTSPRSFTLNFSPDLIWTKNRSVGYWHNLYDAIRGTRVPIHTNVANGNDTANDGLYGGVSAFNTNGFSIEGGTSSSIWANENTQSFVGWAWDAGDVAAVTNNDGTTQSTVKANVDAGFSIVQATISASNETLGHGLGREPAMVIRKKTNNTSEWYTSVKVTGLEGYLLLNATNTFASQGTGFTSTVFNAAYTGGTETWINYCFAPIANYSAFGSWQNNGTNDGTFVYLNFRPKLILLKNTDNVERWYIMDSSRHSYNVAPADATKLSANTADTEGVQLANTATIDFLSNGFKIRTTNPNGGEISFGTRTYFYAAFAENPFSIARAR